MLLWIWTRAEEEEDGRSDRETALEMPRLNIVDNDDNDDYYDEVYFDFEK
jgi:hypothetical protein